MGSPSENMPGGFSHRVDQVLGNFFHKEDQCRGKEEESSEGGNQNQNHDIIQGHGHVLTFNLHSLGCLRVALGLLFLGELPFLALKKFA